MGLEGLTSYKFKLFGNGHTVAEYVKGEKKFTHKPIT
jgi:glutamate-5-semialdehyde dehydrogenase